MVGRRVRGSPQPATGTTNQAQEEKRRRKIQRPAPAIAPRFLPKTTVRADPRQNLGPVGGSVGVIHIPIEPSFSKKNVIEMRPRTQ